MVATLAAQSIEALRKQYSRNLSAAYFVAEKRVVQAEIDRSIVLIGKAREDLTPTEWVAVVEAIDLPCTRCQCTGLYTWGGTINGRPAHSDICYQCEGKGRQSIQDAHRNQGWMRHAIRRACGF